MGTSEGKSRRNDDLTMQLNQNSQLLKIQEAAGLLSVSVSTLYGWVWQRRIPFVKVGRALRFERHDLEKFVQSNRVEARPEMK
jgi:excisionase family DNA binding protein